MNSSVRLNSDKISLENSTGMSDNTHFSNFSILKKKRINTIQVQEKLHAYSLIIMPYQAKINSWCIEGISTFENPFLASLAANSC